MRLILNYSPLPILFIYLFVLFVYFPSMIIRLATTVLGLSGCSSAVTNEILLSIGLSKEGFAFWIKYIGDSALAVTWSDFAVSPH